MEIVLQRLTELNEVKNAILVGKDGLIVAGLMHSEDEEMVGALSAATFGSISDYTMQVKTGNTSSHDRNQSWYGLHARGRRSSSDGDYS